MIRVKRPIGRRLIRNIIMISTLFSILSVGIQLYSDYSSDKDLLIKRIEQVKGSALDSISLNLWENNDKLIQVQLESLLSFNDITYINIDIKNEKGYKYGTNLGDDTIEQEYELTHIYNNKTYSLGVLTIQGSLANIRERIKDRFYLIAFTQTIKTFVVAFITLYLFYYMVTQHLYKIVEFSNDMMDEDCNKALKLELDVKDDELELLSQSLNLLYENVEKKYERFSEKNKELGKVNKILERRLEDDKFVSISKESIKEINHMMNIIKDSESSSYDLLAIKKDLESLSILLKRAFSKKG